MLQHLASVVREVREDAGLRQIDIATRAGVGHVTISRFERGESWPHQLDAVMRAYAMETGVDELDLWRQALDRWGAARERRGRGTGRGGDDQAG